MTPRPISRSTECRCQPFNKPPGTPKLTEQTGNIYENKGQGQEVKESRVECQSMIEPQPGVLTSRLLDSRLLDFLKADG